MNKVFAAIAVLVSLFLTTPIWLYLLYKILDAVHATELMWFLYWIYLPALLLIGVINKAIAPNTK